MLCYLPITLKPASLMKPTIRVGSNYDGGYICCIQDLKKSQILISGGINNNWDFELDFAAMQNKIVHAYDASIGIKYFLKQIFEVIPKPHRYNLLPKRLRNLIRYVTHNPKNVFLHQKYLGPERVSNFVKFEDVLAENSHNKIILKLDIEGWEYRLLDVILRYTSSIETILIEFHEVDLHIKTIENFVKLSGMQVVALVVNTYSEIGLNNVPTVIEMTLTRSGNYQSINNYRDHQRPNMKNHSSWEIEYV